MFPGLSNVCVAHLRPCKSSYYIKQLEHVPANETIHSQMTSLGGFHSQRTHMRYTHLLFANPLHNPYSFSAWTPPLSKFVSRIKMKNSKIHRSVKSKWNTCCESFFISIHKKNMNFRLVEFKSVWPSNFALKLIFQLKKCHYNNIKRYGSLKY